MELHKCKEDPCCKSEVGGWTDGWPFCCTTKRAGCSSSRGFLTHLRHACDCSNVNWQAVTSVSAPRFLAARSPSREKSATSWRHRQERSSHFQELDPAGLNLTCACTTFEARADGRMCSAFSFFPPIACGNRGDALYSGGCLRSPS